MFKKLIKKSYLLIGLIIFIWLAKDINFPLLKLESGKINFFLFGLATIIYILSFFIKAFRWKKMMDFQDIHYSTKDALMIYGSSFLLGIATPGRIGDFSKIFYLRKNNISYGRSSLSSFLEKFLDLFFALTFLVFFSLFIKLPEGFSVNWSVLFRWVTASTLFFAISGFFLYNKSNRIKDFLLEIFEDLKKFRLYELAYLSVVSMIDWFFYILVFFLIALSIGLNLKIGFAYLSFTAMLVIFAALLPISILNIGTREAILIFLFSPFGISKELIILFSLLVMVNYLSIIIIALYFWLKKPLFE